MIHYKIYYCTKRSDCKNGSCIISLITNFSYTNKSKYPRDGASKFEKDGK